MILHYNPSGESCQRSPRLWFLMIRSKWRLTRAWKGPGFNGSAFHVATVKVSLNSACSSDCSIVKGFGVWQSVCYSFQPSSVLLSKMLHMSLRMKKKRKWTFLKLAVESWIMWFNSEAACWNNLDLKNCFKSLMLSDNTNCFQLSG